MQDPQKIGKYTILERIGRGGMGYVYKAVDPILKREVALKCMLKDLSEDPELRSRFSREAQSAGGLRHSNIVTIYDLGEDAQGCPYIAMEFLTGTDLEQTIKSRTELPLFRKLDVIIQTCKGLGYAHSRGIIHRDIKPANIRLLDNGEVKIMDFGIAKIAASHFTRTGMVMGTPHYMSPEQIRGEKVDGRADIFSLGVVLYELLVFRKPYPGDNPTAVLFKIIHSDPEPLVDMNFAPPKGLEKVVLRALAKRPEDRYQTCEEFLHDLLMVYRSIQKSSGEARTDQVATPASATILIHPTSPAPATKVPSTPRPAGVRASSAPAAQTQKGVPVAAAGKPPETPASSSGSLPTFVQQSKAGETEKTTAKLFTPKTAPVARPDLPPISPTPVPIPTKRWLVLGSSGVLGIVLLSVLVFGVLKKVVTNPVEMNPSKPAEVISQPAEIPATKQAVPPAIERTVPPAVLPVSSGWLVLDVQPWAEMKQIKNEKGEFLAHPLVLTPCKIPLEPGKYEITLANSKFESMVIQVEIKSNETTVIHRKMEGFDYAKAVDSLGL